MLYNRFNVQIDYIYSTIANNSSTAEPIIFCILHERCKNNIDRNEEEMGRTKYAIGTDSEDLKMVARGMPDIHFNH